MKRLDNLYEQVISIDNILLADQNARKGKSRQSGIFSFDKDFDQNIANIYRELVTGTYQVSPYKCFKIFEPKERDIYMLPYRDRIVQHLVILILEPMFVSVFTADSYICIKGKGIHAAVRKLKKTLKDTENTTYCLQLDVRKFYPSVNHHILKALLRRKIKDQEFLKLLDIIIDSALGLPIGNYTSQFFANFYLTYFDHWIKEVRVVKYYFRYADDIIILTRCKIDLRKLFFKIEEYLNKKLALEVKSNWRIFPVVVGIDFLGYVFTLIMSG